MGKPVTCDSDDLEVLLLASAGAKKIEEIIHSVRQDPAMIRVQARGQIAAAHDRINRARADAIRDPDARDPLYGTPPTGDDERKLIAELWEYEVVTTNAVHKYTALRLKGLVVMGNAATHLKWGDGEQEYITDTMLRVKLSKIGKQWARENLQAGEGVRDDKES